MRWLGCIIPLALVAFAVITIALEIARQDAGPAPEDVQREIAQRGLSADIEIHVGPARFRAPKGFGESGEFGASDVDWTGRGAVVRAYLGADRVHSAARITLWLPALSTSSPSPDPSSRLDLPQHSITTSVSGVHGLVASLTAPPDTYSPDQARRILAQVLTSVRVDAEALQSGVNDFRRRFAEEHSAKVEAQRMLTEAYRIAFPASLQAADANDILSDADLSDGESRGENYVRGGRIYVVCRVFSDAASLSALTSRLRSFSRQSNRRRVIAIWREPDGDSEDRVLAGESDRYDNDLIALHNAILPILQPGNGVVYVILKDFSNSVREGDVGQIRGFITDVGQHCAAPEDQWSKPASAIADATRVVDRPPPHVPLQTSEQAFQVAAARGPVAQRAFRDSLNDGTPGPIMVAVPAGQFFMGSRPHEVDFPDEEPRLRISIQAPFAVSRFEVTWTQWLQCVAANACEDNGHKTYPGGPPNMLGDAGFGRGNRPVINVSWSDAVAYAEWLSHETGARYRLLSEAEWEYAGRAGTSTEFAFQLRERGDANYAHGLIPDQRSVTLRSVGQFPPNAFGLYDMYGNVWEWTADCYASYGAAGRTRDGAVYDRSECERRALRGGSYQYIVSRMRAATRGYRPPTWRSHDLGIRIARDPES
jgi:formylglycine-generating enzyme required for sulfatase activity